MATASVKEALACGQCLSRCPIYWGRGCIKESFGLSLCKQKKGRAAVWLDFL